MGQRRLKTKGQNIGLENLPFFQNPNVYIYIKSKDTQSSRK